MFRIVVVLLTCLLAHSTVGELMEGRVSAKNGFAFLNKFAFDSDPRSDKSHPDFDPDFFPGLVSIDLDFKDSSFQESDGSYKWETLRSVVIGMYSDEDHSWEPAYTNDNLSCKEKIQMGKGKDLLTLKETMCTKEDGKLTGKCRVPSHFISQSIRPRFWYFVFANCGNNAPEDPSFKDVAYSMHAVQRLDNEWNREFGMNTQGLQTMYLVFFFFYTIGTAIHLYGVRSLWRTQSLHPIVKLLTGAILQSYLSIFFETVHYGTFASNGYGVPALHVLGDLLRVTATLTFFLLLLLLGRGWTITTDVIENRQAIMAGMVAVVILYFVLFIWGLVGVDPALHVYLYDSVPGYLIVILYIGFGGWFAYSCYQSYLRTATDPLKQSFFLRLGMLFTAWFFLLPFTVFLGITLPDYAREKFVETFETVFQALAYAVLSYLLWPTRAEKYFQITAPSVGTFTSTTPYDSL